MKRINLCLRPAAILLLAAVLAFSLVGCLGEPVVPEVTVVAENRLFGDLLYTAYSDGTAVLTGYNGMLTELRLPDKVDGLTLVGIADQAFANNTTLTTLMTGETLSYIGNETFYQCTALETVEIGSNVTRIGYYAFEGTPWMDAQEGPFVVAGDGILIKYKGEEAEVIIPEGIKVISDAFFQNSDLHTVTLGPDVERLDDYAFSYCGNLVEINFNEGLREIGPYAFSFCETVRMIRLPSTVTTIGDSAFMFCSMLRRAELGEGVETIGPNAFNSCSHMTALSLGCGLRSVGSHAFFECFLLHGVTYDGKMDNWTAIDFAQGNDYLTGAALRCLGN